MDSRKLRAAWQAFCFGVVRSAKRFAVLPEPLCSDLAQEAVVLDDGRRVDPMRRR